MTQQVHKTESDAAINIEDKVGLLLGGDLLHLPGVVEHGRVGEVLLGEVTDQRDSLVRVVDALHSVSDSHDKFSFFLHFVDEVIGAETRVECLSELGGCSVQSSTKPVADGEKAGHEGADQVFASPGTHDGVVGAGHRRAVVSRYLRTASLPDVLTVVGDLASMAILRGCGTLARVTRI